MALRELRDGGDITSTNLFSPMNPSMNSFELAMAPSSVQDGVLRISRWTFVNTKQPLKIAFWKARTLTQESKLEQMEKEMEKYGLELLGLSEMRWSGTD